MDSEVPEFEPVRAIARREAELPHLKPGYVRLVHLTDPASAERILVSGLDYSRYGMLQSLARAWGNKNEVEYRSSDPRFAGPDMVAVVMDMPFAEHRIHEDVLKSPGLVPAASIVGIIPSGE